MASALGTRDMNIEISPGMAYHSMRRGKGEGGGGPRRGSDTHTQHTHTHSFWFKTFPVPTRVCHVWFVWQARGWQCPLGAKRGCCVVASGGQWRCCACSSGDGLYWLRAWFCCRSFVWFRVGGWRCSVGRCGFYRFAVRRKSSSQASSSPYLGANALKGGPSAPNRVSTRRRFKGGLGDLSSPRSEINYHGGQPTRANAKCGQTPQ